MTGVLGKRLLISLTFVFVILLTVFILFVVILYEPTNQSNEHSNLYQVTEVNPLNSNSSSFGVIKLSRPLPKGKFISYMDSSGRFISISEFLNSAKYECYGTCYCSSPESYENEMERRVGILGKSLVFLVSAISATMAMSISVEYFREKCIALMKPVCSSVDDAIADFQKCKKEKKELDEESEGELFNEDVDTHIEGIMVDETEADFHFRCKGRCQRHIDYEMTLSSEVVAKKFDCREKVTFGNVVITDYKEVPSYLEWKAMNKFATDYLVAYCEKVSYLKRYGRSLCSGSESITGVWENVECTQINPDGTIFVIEEKEK